MAARRAARFRLRRLWWRADRAPRPRTRLPVRRIGPDDGWCEDPRDRRYNQPIRVPPDSAGDRLWREDRLYDFIVELDHNTRPRVAGRGSAVFVHVARPGFAPTAGCVALDRGALRRLIARLGPRTRSQSADIEFSGHAAVQHWRPNIMHLCRSHRPTLTDSCKVCP